MSTLYALVRAVRTFVSRTDWQHWALLGTMIVTTIGPEMVNALSQSGFSSQAASLSHVLGLVAGVLALLKQLGPTIAPSVPGASSAVDTSKTDPRPPLT